MCLITACFRVKKWEPPPVQSRSSALMDYNGDGVVTAAELRRWAGAERGRDRPNVIPQPSDMAAARAKAPHLSPNSNYRIQNFKKNEYYY